MRAALLIAFLLCQDKKDYPPLPPAADSPAYGANIQRTMTLLATSTPQRRNKVRILFYGQSITEQNWWKLVAEDLRRRFPNADLDIQNKAVGGFASQILSRVAEHDVYAFYPDLVIFHVYGANNTYEEIIRGIRTRTTAEVLIQRDHVAAQWPVDNPEQKHPMWWDHMMNNVFLPDYAKKYRCGLADVRGAWVGYLKSNHLEPRALLTDDVHLNDHGCFVMSEIVKRYLVHKPDLLTDEAKASVRTLEVGKDLKGEGGSLKLAFEGNRVDLLAGKGAAGTAKILIDGRKPSEFSECIAFTRTSPSQSGWGPGLLRVSSEKPRLVEDWVLKVTEVDEKAERIKFTVTGSKTGADGDGVSAERFVSTSGRVVIEPGDWWVKNIQQMTKAKVPVGFEIKWKAIPLFSDTFAAPKIDDESREVPITIAQGLPNGKHTLEITGPAAVRAVRIYRPPVAAP
jgi:hypothetical protein